MFIKLMYNTTRNKLSALIQFITPIINIMLSVFVSRTWKFLTSLPPLELALESGFLDTETILSQTPGLPDDSLTAKSLRAYKDHFKTSDYPGMRLTDIGTMGLGKFYLKMVSNVRL